MEQLPPRLPHPTHRAAGKEKRSARHPRAEFRPRNAFILFRADFVEQNLAPKGVIYDSRKQSQIIGKIWAGMSEVEKEPWIRMSNEEKDRYWVSHQSLVTSRKSNKHPKPHLDADALPSQTNTPASLSTSDLSCHSDTSPLTTDSTRRSVIGRAEWDQLRPFLPSHWTEEWYVIVEYLTAHALDIMDALREGKDLESILHDGCPSTDLSHSAFPTTGDPQHHQDVALYTISTGDYSGSSSLDIPGCMRGSGSGPHHGLQYVGAMDSSSFSGHTDSAYSFESQDMVSTTPSTSSPFSNDLSGHNDDTAWSNHYDDGKSQSNSTYFWNLVAEARNDTSGILLDHTSRTDSGDPATFGTPFGRSSDAQQYSCFSIQRSEEIDYTPCFYDFGVTLDSDPMSVGLFENGGARLDSNSTSFFEMPSDASFTGTGLHQSTSLQFSEGVGFPRFVCDFSVGGPDLSYGDFFSGDAASLNINSANVALGDSPVGQECFSVLNQELCFIPSPWECVVDERHTTIGALFEDVESALNMHDISSAQSCFAVSNSGLGLYPYLGDFPAEIPDPTYEWLFEGNGESLFDNVPVALGISDMHMPLYFPVESSINAISQNSCDSLSPVL